MSIKGKYLPFPAGVFTHFPFATLAKQFFGEACVTCGIKLIDGNSTGLSGRIFGGIILFGTLS